MNCRLYINFCTYNEHSVYKYEHFGDCMKDNIRITFKLVSSSFCKMDPSWRHPFSSIVSGPSGCGKTQFTLKFIDHLEHMVVPPNRKSNVVFRNIPGHIRQIPPDRVSRRTAKFGSFRWKGKNPPCLG